MAVAEAVGVVLALSVRLYLLMAAVTVAALTFKGLLNL
jgi:hypothetical protein